MAKWEAFQADTLDILRQYQGYFDFFEGIGSVEDSRPDCLCRITRENKKEIWIVDAKNKKSLDTSDKERINNYIEKISSNPLEVGLDFSEIDNYNIRAITVMKKFSEDEKIESVKITALHQFLQRELIYSNIGKVVRDISKLMKKGQLGQSEARMLYESVEPYRETFESAISELEELERDTEGFDIIMNSSEHTKSDIPVDLALKNEFRNIEFLIDIPYSEKALNDIKTKIKRLKQEIEEENLDLYYAVVSIFGSEELELVYNPEEIKEVIKRKAGVVGVNEIAEIFEPAVPVEKNIEKNKAEITALQSVDYHVSVKVEKDHQVNIKIKMPEEARSKLKNFFHNSRSSLGKFEGPLYVLEFEVHPENRIEGIEGVESFDMVKEKLSANLMGEINPVLSRRFNDLR